MSNMAALVRIGNHIINPQHFAHVDLNFRGGVAFYAPGLVLSPQGPVMVPALRLEGDEAEAFRQAIEAHPEIMGLHVVEVLAGIAQAAKPGPRIALA
jgi:hypothetical protein